MKTIEEKYAELLKKHSKTQDELIEALKELIELKLEQING